MLPIRDENPTSTFPLVTLALIAANVIAFAYESSLPPHLAQDLVQHRGLVPALVTQVPSSGGMTIGPGLLSFVTSMFLHGGFIHLAGNMLFLWIFGNNVEDTLGRFRFVAFYAISGFAAAFTQIVARPDSDVPMIGASGAIAGVLGAYMLLFPRARILTLVPLFFVTVVRLPAFVFLGMWFLFQALYSAAHAGQEGGGVAWFAHVGGFVAGMILLGVFGRRRTGPGLSAPEELRL